MHAFPLFRRFITHFTALCLLGAGLFAPMAQAAMIGTATVIEAQSDQQARTAVTSHLQRADVQAGLIAQGVDPAMVQARVDSLSAQEIASLSSQLDNLPAGAGVELLLLVFIVLLLTDIAGLTNIFTFVK